MLATSSEDEWGTLLVALATDPARDMAVRILGADRLAELGGPAAVDALDRMAHDTELRTYTDTPIEAFPDVTDVQTNLVTLFPGHAPEEVEKQITIPLEIALSGVPHAVRLFSHTQFGLSFISMTFDDQVNLGALNNYTTVFSPNPTAEINGKCTVRMIGGVGVRPTNWAHYMFVTVKDPATGTPKAIDVLELATGLRVDVNRFHPGVQSIPARGAAVVMDYFRE